MHGLISALLITFFEGEHLFIEGGKFSDVNLCDSFLFGEFFSTYGNIRKAEMERKNAFD